MECAEKLKDERMRLGSEVGNEDSNLDLTGISEGDLNQDPISERTLSEECIEIEAQHRYTQSLRFRFNKCEAIRIKILPINQKKRERDFAHDGGIHRRLIDVRDKASCECIYRDE
ncbi:uncharacterized protein G2W53_000312 [Senna tora]|uniref:Uncharacterized protein n=1 Tax=Senna tora TaxID=362788 RepID=A0A835CLH4_9FABA|nr:uncharacterized protein G2W53_000312 [Senna tora]